MIFIMALEIEKQKQVYQDVTSSYLIKTNLFFLKYVKVKEKNGQELQITFPTRQETCLNFVLGLWKSAEENKVKPQVFGFITISGP